MLKTLNCIAKRLREKRCNTRQAISTDQRLRVIGHTSRILTADGREFGLQPQLLPRQVVFLREVVDIASNSLKKNCGQVVQKHTGRSLRTYMLRIHTYVSQYIIDSVYIRMLVMPSKLHPKSRYKYSTQYTSPSEHPTNLQSDWEVRRYDTTLCNRMVNVMEIQSWKCCLRHGPRDLGTTRSGCDMMKQQAQTEIQTDP